MLTFSRSHTETIGLFTPRPPPLQDFAIVKLLGKLGVQVRPLLDRPQHHHTRPGCDCSGRRQQLPQHCDADANSCCPTPGLPCPLHSTHAAAGCCVTAVTSIHTVAASKQYTPTPDMTALSNLGGGLSPRRTLHPAPARVAPLPRQPTQAAAAAASRPILLCMLPATTAACPTRAL